MLKVTIRRGRDGQYYFRFVSANGRIVAIGGEGYTRLASAKRAVRRFLEALAGKGASGLSR